MTYWTKSEIERLRASAERYGNIRRAAAETGRSYAACRAVLLRNSITPANCRTGGDWRQRLDRAADAEQ